MGTGIRDELGMAEPLSNIADIIPAGYILGKRYEIKGLVGSGGMAKVYQAFDRKFGIDIALKLLEAKHYSDKEYVDRFKREAQAAAKLNHRSIARPYDVGETDGLHFISMEFVQGRTLEHIMDEYCEQEKFFPILDACTIIREVLDALRYAHGEGVIHRDIKPGNIMITPKNEVKITDFGIAKIIPAEGGAQNTLVTTGLPFGTPQYMSPEQLRNERERITGKTDVFSTGMILYEMLTLQPPYDNVKETDASTKIANILIKKLKEPRTVNREIPRQLEDIILKSLDKNPDQRYDAEGFYQALDSFIKGEKVSVEGSFRRRMELGRRKFIIKAGLGAIALTAMIGGPIIYIAEHNEYQESIYSTIDRIQRPEIDSLEKVIPLLKELYPKLCKRLEWMYDVELSKHLQTGKNNEKPMIYPIGSTNYPGREGEFMYINGESGLSGFIASLMYYLYDTMEGQSKDEKMLKSIQLLREKNKKILDDFLIYTTKLYFVESADKKDSSTKSDEETRVINRFYYPAKQVLTDLKSNHPERFRSIETEASAITLNYAKAVKIALEKIIYHALENPAEFGISRDNEIALTVCESFRLLDVQRQIVSQYNEYGSRIKNIRDVLELIIREADAKIAWLNNADNLKGRIVSKDFAGFIAGLIQRNNLLEEIIVKKSDNTILNLNIQSLNAYNGGLSQDYLNYLNEKKDNYDKAIQEMICHFISKTRSIISGYYLEEGISAENPIDMIASLRFWEAIRNYSKPKIGNMNKDEIELKIIKSLLTENYVSGKNKLPVSLQNPFGFIKNTVANIRYKPGIGTTSMESDYLFFKNVISIIKK